MSDEATSARREGAAILFIWTTFAAWVLGYAAWKVYGTAPDEVTLILGLPTWVIWGIAIPWLAASLVTMGFSLWGMKDDADE